ncbi:circumsporozoite protein-like [Liolophura sinensis]|uniref:circumsporozoite protein-like n=1 Tax=Liolophura sinensis TaxID=3198878 RepID=UPI0031591790
MMKFTLLSIFLVALSLANAARLTSKAPEDTQATERTQVPQVPEGSQAPEKTQEPEGSQVPEGTQAPEGTQEPERTQVPQGPLAPERTQEPEGTHVPEGTQAPEGTQEPDRTQEPQGTQVPEGTQAPERTQEPQGTEESVQEEYPEVPEEEAVTADEGDIADVENDEDDQDQRRVECTPGVEFLEDPKNCGRFYQCVNGVPNRLDCPAGLYFNINTKVCDWPSNVNCDLDRCDRRRVGRWSGSEDDAQSTVSCPRGHLPLNCAATDPSRSDGVFLDGRTCTAVNSAGGPGQRAVATCVRVAIDEAVITIVTSGRWLRTPIAQCPRGYRVMNCFIRNPWNHVRFAHPYMILSGNYCRAHRTCTAGRGCMAQAVCRRRAGF